MNLRLKEASAQVLVPLQTVHELTHAMLGLSPASPFFCYLSLGYIMQDMGNKVGVDNLKCYLDHFGQYYV